MERTARRQTKTLLFQMCLVVVAAMLVLSSIHPCVADNNTTAINLFNLQAESARLYAEALATHLRILTENYHELRRWEAMYDNSCKQLRQIEDLERYCRHSAFAVNGSFATAVDARRRPQSSARCDTEPVVQLVDRVDTHTLYAIAPGIQNWAAGRAAFFYRLVRISQPIAECLKGLEMMDDGVCQCVHHGCTDQEWVNLIDQLNRLPAIEGMLWMQKEVEFPLQKDRTWFDGLLSGLAGLLAPVSWYLEPIFEYAGFRRALDWAFGRLGL